MSRVLVCYLLSTCATLASAMPISFSSLKIDLAAEGKWCGKSDHPNGPCFLVQMRGVKSQAGVALPDLVMIPLQDNGQIAYVDDRMNIADLMLANAFFNGTEIDKKQTSDVIDRVEVTLEDLTQVSAAELLGRANTFGADTFTLGTVNLSLYLKIEDKVLGPIIRRFGIPKKDD